MISRPRPQSRRQAPKRTASKRSAWTAADLFCGAGGTTEGARQAGVDVVLAVNHWRTAVLTHQQNHPSVRHICARIGHVNVRHDPTIPDLDLLLASPECTHFSVARGGQPVDDQKRQPAFGLLDWLDAKRPRFAAIENVREFRDWGPLVNLGTEKNPRWRPDPRHKGETFAAWGRSIEALGYRVDHQLLNAADFGAATRRVRLFVVAVREDVYRRGLKEIPWPEPTHSRENWQPAWSIIDWSKPCPSIFARKRPLADKTLKRIEIGLRKFVGEAADPFVVVLRKNQDADPIAGPLSTICTSGAHHGLAVPFQFKAIGRCPGLTKPITDPIPTIVPNHTKAGS